MRDCFATHEHLQEFFSCEIRNPRKFALCNTKSWSLESGIRNPTKDWNPEFQGPLTKTGIQYLESRIHSVKSGIQDDMMATLSSVASYQ